MGRVRGTLAGCVGAIALFVAPASATAPSPPRAGYLVDGLIAVMLKDAAEQARRMPDRVQVVGPWCGYRTISAHHAAYLGPHVLYDRYILRIKADRNEVLGLAVSQPLRETQHA